MRRHARSVKSKRPVVRDDASVPDCSGERTRKVEGQLTTALMRSVVVGMAAKQFRLSVEIEIVFQLHVDIDCTTVSGCRTKSDQPGCGNCSLGQTKWKRLDRADVCDFTIARKDNSQNYAPGNRIPACRFGVLRFRFRKHARAFGYLRRWIDTIWIVRIVSMTAAWSVVTPIVTSIAHVAIATWSNAASVSFANALAVSSPHSAEVAWAIRKR